MNPNAGIEEVNKYGDKFSTKKQVDNFISNHSFKELSKISNTDKEINKIKDQIDWSNYYKPEWSMFDLIKSNVEYELADGDQHPNHLAYEKWSIDFIDWIENK